MKVITIPIGPLQTNCYVVACPENSAAAVIDPAWSGESLFQFVEQEGFDIEVILLTHAHFDHIAGAAALRRLSGSRLLAHPDSEPLLAQAARHAQAWGIQIEPAPDIDGDLVDGQVIQVGTLRLEVLYTPGHAPGHVCFYERSVGAVFDGDVLFSGSIGRADLPGGNYERLLTSIREKLLTLPDETAVYSGHGPATTIGRERLYNPFLR
jgi:glyoxylase-like metal-dependent hydrolase (beta-lactamase superfamily II)